MLKKTLINIIFSTLVLLIVSCDKKDSIVYPQVYESKFITDTSFKVFTKNGEITDKVSIEKLLEPFNWLFTDIENSTIEGEIIVRYNSPNEVEIQEKNNTEIDYRDIYNISGINYWEKRDTTYTRSSLSEFEKFFIHHPIYQEESTMPIFNETHTSYKHCYYTKNREGKILFPLLDFVIFEYSFSPKSGAGKINNEFDFNRISKLADNDTLVVQTYTIELIVK